MAAVLVTGAAGFIGSHFVRYWLAAHPTDDVVALDALTQVGAERNIAALEGRLQFVHADIGDADLLRKVLAAHEIEIVVHLAGQSHNSLAALEPDRFFRTNVLGTHALLDVCRRAEVRHFHHVSSCGVYGGLAPDAVDAFTEESPYRPQTPFSASKAAADHVVRSYHRTYGMPITITNSASNYGARQFPDKVIPHFVIRALRGEPLPIYAAGTGKREWMHVDDHCRAIDEVLRRGNVGETYHVGTGVEASADELADLVLDELGVPGVGKERVADRPGHDGRLLLDSGKIRRELGWRPRVAFDSGVRDTVQWYATKPDWWAPLRGRSSVAELARSDRY